MQNQEKLLKVYTIIIHIKMNLVQKLQIPTLFDFIVNSFYEFDYFINLWYDIKRPLQRHKSPIPRVKIPILLRILISAIICNYYYHLYSPFGCLVAF